MVKITKCKKHPEYQAEKYPTSECKICLHFWNQKKMADRVMLDVDRKFLEYLDSLDVGNE